MFKKKTERHMYRKSPGRQYGADYPSLSGQLDPETRQSSQAPSSPSGSVLSPRPDPRRTRQLMRKNILAGKVRSGVLDPSQDEDDELALPTRGPQSRRPAQPHDYPARRYQTIDEEEIVQDWLQHGESEPDYMDPDLGYEFEEEESDPLAARVRQAPRIPPANPRQTIKFDPETEDELLEEEIEEKRKKAARRKFLLGAVAVGGTAIAAYEIVPRLPGAISAGAGDLEHQLQQAFQNGVTQGANDARKELLNGLDTIEGFSLDGAIEAAKLTRVAYDVFVSPLVTLAAEVAGDFLTVTLDALITGRNWLKQINEDSPTLEALQTVLQSWVDQANTMPQKVQNITDSDLDGAQAYLRALQQKIQQEQAQLNATPTPTSNSHSTPSTVITPPKGH